MKSRFKIGLLLTVGITLVLGLFLATPVSADRVATANDNSQSTKLITPNDNSSTTSSSAEASDKSSSDSDTTVNQNSTSRANTNQNTASANSSSTTANSTSAKSTSTATDNDKQTTSTVSVAVVNDSQPANSQSTATQSNDTSKVKSVKKVTLTTPNSAKQINQQSLSQKIALIPQVSKQALVMTGGIASLVWVPTVVIIFNTLV